MTEQGIGALLRDYKEGTLSEEAALSRLQEISMEDMGFAVLDHQRERRQGFPEVVYAEGKTKEQVLKILQSLLLHSRGNVMATRADEERYQYVKKELPDACYSRKARMIFFEREKVLLEDAPEVLILTAGTSDIPVAEEARLTAKLWGCKVNSHYDCGVAGIHRLLRHVPDIRKASVIIVIAGMEGALASVVGGIADCPVIAVPTSVGYGVSAHGLTALCAMLSSCAAGVSVVNIDNGFGAGVLASKIVRLIQGTKEERA